MYRDNHSTPLVHIAPLASEFHWSAPIGKRIDVVILGLDHHVPCVVHEPDLSVHANRRKTLGEIDAAGTLMERRQSKGAVTADIANILADGYRSQTFTEV